MKILTLANCSLTESQGSGYVVLNYARGLRSRGHEVTVLGPKSTEWLQRVRIGKRHRQALGMALAALVHTIRKRFDVVEFYGAESCLAARLLQGRCFGRQLLVSHSNGIEPYCAQQMRRWLGHATFDGKAPRWYQRCLRLPLKDAFRRVDAVVTVSENDAGFVLQEGYQPATRLLAIENPIHDAYLGRQPRFDRQQSIGFCGSWLPLKGAHLMRVTLPRVLRAFPRATLTLIGVGERFDASNQFPREVLPRIRVHPFVRDKAELRRLYETMSIFVAPSIYESFCLTAAEAMACGCALVATRTGFAASLRHGEDALTFAEPKPASFESALVTVLSDEGLRVRLAKAGYARVQSLRWDRAVLRLEESYERWLREIREGCLS